MAWDSRRRRIAAALSWHKRGHGPSAEPQLHVSSFDARDPEMQLSRLLSPIGEEDAPDVHEAPLQVKVAIRFLDHNVRSVYSRGYGSSQSFEPTERICKGLIRRIEHCTEEMITRKDSDAMNQLHCIRQGPKLLRFDVHFRIYRSETGLWAERTFRSYQKQPLTAEMTHDIARSTHRTIGLFLRRYDDQFQWIDEPYKEYIQETPALFKPSPNGPLSLACIPNARFMESSQTWEFVPGYTMELSFRSHSRARQQPEWRRTLRVSSKQSTPLNLGLGESLLWQAYRAVQNELDIRKEDFDREHESYDGFEGIFDPQYFEEDVLAITLRVMNNLGPAYDHFSRNFQSKLRLFSHPQGEDCAAFLRNVQTHFVGIRDKLDTRIQGINDFDFRILELRGRGWEEKNAARFTIDGSESFSRHSVQAMLDRIHTSIVDILHGHDIAIHIVAHKRGHLVLDKALVAHEEEHIGRQLVLSPEQHKDMFHCRLRAKIQAALDCLCMDTLSIDDIPEDLVVELESQPAIVEELEAQDETESVPVVAATPPSPNSFIIDGHRVFPLVPVKYEEHLRTSSASTSVRNSVLDLNAAVSGADLESSSQEPIEQSATEKETSKSTIINEPTPENAVSLEQDSDEAVAEPVAEDTTTSFDNSISESQEDTSNVQEPATPAQVSTDAESSSTRPSTPGLSSAGTPSPRNSLLITPTFLRTMSGTQEPLVSDTDMSPAVQTPGPSGDVERFNFNLVTTKKSNESQLRDGNYPTPPESEVASVDMDRMNESGEPDEPEQGSEKTEKAEALLIEDASICDISDLSSFPDLNESALEVQDAVSATDIEKSADSITESEASEALSETELDESFQPEIEQDDSQEPDTRLCEIQEPDVRETEEIAPPEFEHVEVIEDQQLVDSSRSELSQEESSEPEMAADPIIVSDAEDRPTSPISIQEAVEVDGLPDTSVGTEVTNSEDLDSALAGPIMIPEQPVILPLAQEEEYQSFPQPVDFDGPTEFVEDPSRSKIDFFEDDEDLEADVRTEPEQLSSMDEQPELIIEESTPAQIISPDLSPELAPVESNDESREVCSLSEIVELTETVADDKQSEVEPRLTENIISELTEDEKSDNEDDILSDNIITDIALDDNIGDEESDEAVIPVLESAEQVQISTETPPALVCNPSPLVDQDIVETTTTPLEEPAPTVQPEIEATTATRSESPVAQESASPTASQSLLLPPLSAPSCRSSVSSWEDYESAARASTSKDSVDTIINPDDPVLFPPPGPDNRFSRPTTGYLGLHEERLVEVGLRSALGGPNRAFEVFSDSRPATAPSAAPASPTKSASRVLRLRKRSNSAFKAIVKSPRLKKGKSTTKLAGPTDVGQVQESSEATKEVEVEGEDSKGMLPRMMMLFAGMAIASQVANKSR